MKVIKELVYYSAKAACFVIISTVANFFEQIHSLQDINLTSFSRNFTFSKPRFVSKPPFVPPLRTLYTCYEYIQQLKNSYIVFDDEYNRIASVLNKTKDMVKGIFREYYKKLSMNCFNEI